jgi:leucyl aminopeptidase
LSKYIISVTIKQKKEREAMEIKAIKDIDSEKFEVLVINMFENEKTTQELANKFAIKKDKFEGKFCTTYLLHTLGQEKFDKILVVGFGKREEFDANRCREAISKATKKLQQIHCKSACFDLATELDYGKSATLGVSIANYAFDKYKSKKAPRVEKIYFTKFSEKEVKEGNIFANAMDFTRNLSNDSAAVITPKKLAEVAESLKGITTRVYDKDEIKRLKMGAFLAVSQGSHQEPRFIHMKYTGKKVTKKIAIIGKGLTFDAGGLDLKPASSMLTMRDDMSGAACILGVMSALSELNPDIEVNGIIAACENMPGCKAYKPGDVLTAKNGKTIEVDNTDAEGRLTLADALCFAEELGVDEIVDIATLTGACVVALGSTVSGIMGNDEKLVQKLIQIGKKSGEKFWELPMYDDYFESIKSNIADMKNTGSRQGGASIAGVFLREFVTDKVKWAHLDVAGTAFIEKPHNEFIEGSTGMGVRTLLNYICEK